MYYTSMGELDTTTGRLAQFVVASRKRRLSSEVLVATRQYFANSLATSISGSQHQVVGNIVSAALRAGQKGQYRLSGRSEGLSLPFAVLATGTAAAVDDFDDTHMATFVHAGPGLAGAGFVLAQGLPINGYQLLEAVALGYEAQLRVAAAVAPEIYSAGWHTTGVFGPIGAAALTGTLLHFDESQMFNALTLASEWTIGHLEGLGTMNKSFHAGKAASNGVDAAMTCASVAFESVHDDPIEHLLDALTTGWQPRIVDAQRDSHWELLENRIKPFPCGVVAHASVEAALGIRATSGVRHEEIGKISVTCSPRAGQLTAVSSPSSELDARLSIPHGVAAALARGVAGIDEFSAESIDDPVIADLRRRVELIVNEDTAEESAQIEVTTTVGTVIIGGVKAANGSAARPMSESAVVEKIQKLVTPIIRDRADELMERLDRLEESTDLQSLARLVVGVEREGNL